MARATSSWSPNSGQSSGDSGGGPGWSTSPVVYPGPSSTTTGRVSKRAPTSESSSFSVDITAIVRAWAPGLGGGRRRGGQLRGPPLPVASGDITEVSSHESTYHPYITLTYETDTPPPAPTITGPTGVVPSVRPDLTATAVDVDGDPLEAGDVEVRQGATVVYSAVGFAASGAPPPFTHVPATDLPSGALTVRMRAKAGGVYGAWSAEAPFTVDRPAHGGLITAPAASVAGPAARSTFTWPTRTPMATWRGVMTSRCTDTGGGGGRRSKGPGPPTPALAGTSPQPQRWTSRRGPSSVRSRVQARGAWSAWSACRPFRVVLTVPIRGVELAPPRTGGFPVRLADLQDLAGRAPTSRLSLRLVPGRGPVRDRPSPGSNQGGSTRIRAWWPDTDGAA